MVTRYNIKRKARVFVYRHREGLYMLLVLTLVVMALGVAGREDVTAMGF